MRRHSKQGSRGAVIARRTAGGRKWIAVAFACLAIGGALFVALRRRGEERHVARGHETNGRPERSLAAPPPRTPFVPSSSGDEPSDRAPTPSRPGEKFSEERVPLAPSEVQRGHEDPGPGPYLEKYQGRSGRLSQAGLRPDAMPVQNASQGREPELVVWPSSTRVTPPQVVRIHATLSDGSGRRADPEAIEVRVAPSGVEAAECSTMDSGWASGIGVDLIIGSGSPKWLKFGESTENACCLRLTEGGS